MSAPSRLVAPPSKGATSLYFARMFEWHGLSPAGTAPCPRWAAGRHHRRGGECDCDAIRANPISDHAFAWRRPDGARVLTFEPYGIDMFRFLDLEFSVEALGLAVTVSPESPWYPGSTTLLLIEAAPNERKHP